MKRVRRLYITDYGLTPVRKIENMGILCEDGQIIAVGGVSCFSQDEEELEVYEIPNSYAMPGFIDTHIHGAGGFDTSTPESTSATLEMMSMSLALRGVTSFVPTIVTNKPDVLLHNLSMLSDMMKRSYSGAEAVGIHVEGPFISRKKCGSQQYPCEIDLGYAREILSAGGGMIKRVTFAPELDGATDLVEILVTANVAPSMGHSQANEAETLRAIDAGARCVTHLYNGMPPLHQRELSLTSVALTDDRVTTELIIDGRHINPRMVNLACRCKPADKIVAISDAIMAAGMPEGNYHIGPTDIVVENSSSRSTSGFMTGTTTMLDDGWHSLMSYAETSEIIAAQAVTLNPARSMQLFDRGELSPKTRADIAIFDRQNNRPLMTICRGKIVFSDKSYMTKQATKRSNEDK